VPVLLFDHSLVRALLPVRDCIECMAQALTGLENGTSYQPLRLVVPLRDRSGAVAAMPAVSEAPAGLGVKVISFFPGNLGTERDPHQGVVLLFSTVNGELLAVFDASAITAIRTAAVSGLATRLLARSDATRLALLGTGIQARTHLEAMLAVRPFTQVRVWGRDPERTAKFVGWAMERMGRQIEIAPTAQDAVRDADVVCTVTSAREPILEGAWIAPGTHLNVVGSSARNAREVDTACMVRAQLFVDRRESALAEAGDFLIPLREGAVSEEHIRGELGQVLLGRVPGRTDPSAVTLFKSLGLGIEDLAAATHIYRVGRSGGAGFAFDFGGSRGAW
jgi:ornithine cyclodeaminase